MNALRDFRGLHLWFDSRLVCISVVCCFLTTGCQHDVVQRGANRLTSTVPALYYEQVLDNIAMASANAELLPYFGVPAQATHTNSRQIQAGYTPGWDFIPALQGYFFDKQSAVLQGQVQNQQAFQLLPVTNPDKLMLMQAAYKVVTGNDADPTVAENLRQYYEVTNYYFDYDTWVKPGWFYVTYSRREAKKALKCGCFIGSYQGCQGCAYVCVPPENIAQLSKFTLAILDIATLDADYFYGNKATHTPNTPDTATESAPRVLPKRLQPKPFPAPPIAPSL